MIILHSQSRDRYSAIMISWQSSFQRFPRESDCLGCRASTFFSSKLSENNQTTKTARGIGSISRCCSGNESALQYQDQFQQLSCILSRLKPRPCKRTQHCWPTFSSIVGCYFMLRPCKRTQHCWPTLSSIVGCYFMLRPHTLLHVVPQCLKPVKRLSTCKRTQQLPTQLGQQYWQLLRLSYYEA